jgi:hypothetical protein
MEEISNAYGVVMVSLLGRLREKCEDNIKIYLREMRCEIDM